MAQYFIDTRTREILATGMTEQEFQALVPNTFRDARGWWANGLQANLAVERLHRSLQAGGPPKATEKQIAFARSLLRRHAEGSLDYTDEQLREMPREEISILIDSLKREW